MKWFAVKVVRPILKMEPPGWGKLYDLFVGGAKSDDYWEDTTPVIIRDKRNGFLRILEPRGWSDRFFYFLSRWHELPAQLALEKYVRDGDHVVDVGANVGHFTLAAAHSVGRSGRVTSFEPNPIVYSRLMQHIHLNNLPMVEAKNAGASDKKDTLTLTVPAANSGEATFGKSIHGDTREFTCPVVRLDDLGLEGRVSFVKIDVEGFEVFVLNGARALLDQHKPIVMTEVIAGQLENAGSSKGALVQTLKDMGYTPHLMGLEGRGSNQSLTLTPQQPTAEMPNGDYLWFAAGGAKP